MEEQVQLDLLASVPSSAVAVQLEACDRQHLLKCSCWLHLILQESNTHLLSLHLKLYHDLDVRYLEGQLFVIDLWLSQGSYRSWKTWKVMEFKYFSFQAWKVMEFNFWKGMENYSVCGTEITVCVVRKLPSPVRSICWCGVEPSSINVWEKRCRCRLARTK